MIFFKKKVVGTGNIAQQAAVPATKPDDWSLIPRICIVENETELHSHTMIYGIHTHTPVNTCTHMYDYIHIYSIHIIWERMRREAVKRGERNRKKGREEKEEMKQEKWTENKEVKR